MDDVVNFILCCRLWLIPCYVYSVLHYIVIEKALKCKPLVNCACSVPLIDGLGYLYAFTRGLHASIAHGESDTGLLQQ